MTSYIKKGKELLNKDKVFEQMFKDHIKQSNKDKDFI